MENRTTLIDIRDVTRIYPMGSTVVRALRGVSLIVKQNEYVAIMGSSGSGKSTLMNIIGCLDTATSGQYYLNGQNVGDLADNDLADIRNREIGFVFQTFNLLPRFNCLHNVELPLIYAGVRKSVRRELAVEALVSVGLEDRIDHKPNELSSGERQRVALARALVNKPSILLADEPTGNLDSKTGEEIMEVFEALYRRGNTLLVVTHELHIANHARRTIYLHDGMIVRDEPVEGELPPGAIQLAGPL